MAYFYRLIVVLVCVLSQPAFASFPSTPVYTAQFYSTSAEGGSPAAACVAVAAINTYYNASSNRGADAFSTGYDGVSMCGIDMTTYYKDANGKQTMGHQVQTAYVSSPVATCPSSSTLAGGACSCTAPAVQNSANNACIGPCDSGQSRNTTVQLGWFAPDDLVGVYTAQNAATQGEGCQGGFGAGGGQACKVNYTASAAPMGVPGAFGHSSYTAYLTGATSGGGSCSAVPVVPLPAEPPCAGQLGTFNGVARCLPKTSDSDLAALAAKAAAAAAEAASVLARAAPGATDKSIAAAGAAAGSAASRAVQSGANSSEAAQAGAAAGAAASNQSINTPASSASDVSAAAAAAAAGALATARAIAIAAASGASPTVAASIGAQAGAAASAAASAALRNGGSSSAVGAAGSAAGINATASGILNNGSTPSSSQVVGAASAGAGAAAGATSLLGTSADPTQPQDPIGDFCKRNPQVKLCKTEVDSNWAQTPCANVPTCSGDAVLCAVALQTFKTQCALADPETPHDLYDVAITKTGDMTKDNPNNSEVDIGPSKFDGAEVLGGGSGMSDLTVTVMGSSIVLPFSMVNIWLLRLGYVLKACTFLLCARIVTRG